MAELSNELKTIKKLYGENFMKMCRTLFPSLLENEGLLLSVLTSNFANNARTLYEDIHSNHLEEEFKSYIYSKIDVEKDEKQLIEKKTPYELLDEAGYDLYECTTEDEIQQFKKYYQPGEELCTFHGGRLGRCVVFWAVKKNAEEIKREDFSQPQREDEYGTSVMGIQFTKHGMCTVSIKNRYNHTVNNPDATYGNDLDRIAPGLEQAFADLLLERGLELNGSNKEEFKIPGYVKASDGRYYKYNMESYGAFYCPSNVIIDGGSVQKLEPEKELLIDNFIIDLENKKIRPHYEDFFGEPDPFIDAFDPSVGNIEKIEVLKDKQAGDGKRIIHIKMDTQEKPIVIKIDKDNQIIGYENEKLEEIGDDFLYFNKSLQQLKLPNLRRVGENFLHHNSKIQRLEMPNLQQVGNYFLYLNDSLLQLELSNLQQAGDGFLNNNVNLQQLELPNLQQVRHNFLCNNTELQQLNLPNLRQIGNNFLCQNRHLQQLELPNIQRVGNFFLEQNERMQQLHLPNLKQVGYGFMENNAILYELDVNSLQRFGNYFLYKNTGLTHLELPSLQQEIEPDFMPLNQNIKRSELSKTAEGHSEEVDITVIENKNNSIIEEIVEPLITNRDIAELDKNNSLTTRETSWGKRVIEKIKDWFKKKDNKDDRM